VHQIYGNKKNFSLDFSPIIQNLGFVMPTYEYKCLSCGHSFELFQSMSADPVTKCYKCNGDVKRLIGAGAGPIFKGSGFYQTDYKNSAVKANTSSNINKMKESKETPSAKKNKSKNKGE